MSTRREDRPKGRTPKNTSTGTNDRHQRKSGGNPSRPGYLQPKGKNAASKFMRNDDGASKRSGDKKPYASRRGPNIEGRDASKPRFLQPKDGMPGNEREERRYRGKGTPQPENPRKSWDKKDSTDNHFKPKDQGRTTKSRLVRKPAEGNNYDKKSYLKKDRDNNPRREKSQYSERNKRNAFGRGEEKRPHFKKEDEFNRDNQTKPTYSKRPDSKTPHADREERRPYKKNNEGGRVERENRGKTYDTKSRGKKSFDKEGNLNKAYSDKDAGFSSKPGRDKTQKITNENTGRETSKIKGQIRLNKYIANSGICSRRDADLLIQAGEITVNGKVVTEMGHKVDQDDEIRYNNRKLKREKLVYVLLNKPKDFITTTDDPENRKTIMQLVEGAGQERIYPVGRLDRNTTGLILLTNDGELADKLSHPSNNIKKLYQVDIDKPISEEDFFKITEGVTLEDGLAVVDQLAIVSTDRTSLGLQIHSGKNRIVRRIFEHLGYDVVKLDRVMYAGLDKKDLPRGKWRLLSEKEVIQLKFLKSN